MLLHQNLIWCDNGDSPLRHTERFNQSICARCRSRLSGLHPIVVADLFVLVPRSGLAALGATLAHFVGVFPGVCEEHATGASGYYLVAVEADAVVVAERSCFPPFDTLPVFCSEAFRGVFDDECAVFIRDPLDLFGFA